MNNTHRLVRPAVIAVVAVAITLTGCTRVSRHAIGRSAARGAAAAGGAAAANHVVNGALNHNGGGTPAPAGSGSVPGGAATPGSLVAANGHGWTPAGLDGPQRAPGSCHERKAANGFALPDPVCTPGAIDAAVTQANIATTICKSGYTATVRPPTSITGPAKLASMRAYGDADSAANYEYDHLLPLELGGSSSTLSIWPESRSEGQSQKDLLENELNKAVCSGKIKLAAAQQAITHDWTTAKQVLGLP